MRRAAYGPRGSLLFVCTGNLCRSPLAERLLHVWTLQGMPVDVSSAGIQAEVGSPMDARAAEALRGLGGDPGNFRARALTQAITRWTPILY